MSPTLELLGPHPGDRPGVGACRRGPGCQASADRPWPSTATRRDMGLPSCRKLPVANVLPCLVSMLAVSLNNKQSDFMMSSKRERNNHTVAERLSDTGAPNPYCLSQSV